jgi:hypothetical protein
LEAVAALDLEVVALEDFMRFQMLAFRALVTRLSLVQVETNHPIAALQDLTAPLALSLTSGPLEEAVEAEEAVVPVLPQETTPPPYQEKGCRDLEEGPQAPPASQQLAVPDTKQEENALHQVSTLEEAVEARLKTATTITSQILVVAVTEARAQSQAPLSPTLAEVGPSALLRLPQEEQAIQTRVEAARQEELKGVWRSGVLAKTA